MINKFIDGNFEAGIYKCLYDSGVFTPSEEYLVKSVIKNEWRRIRISNGQFSTTGVWRTEYSAYRVLKYYEGITSFQELQELHPEEFI